MIRQATLEDIDWIMTVAKRAYVDGTFDDEACRKYWKSIIESPYCLLLRGEKAVMGFAVVGIPYLPSFKVAITLPICSLGGGARELFQMTAMGIDWAKSMGAKHCDFAAVTGKDLGALARHFGGKPISPAYRVEFNHV